MMQQLRFAEYAKLDSGFAFKSSDWRMEGVPVVKIKNVKDGFVSLEDCSFVTPEVAARAISYQASAGDVLISLTGYVGQVGRVLPGDKVLVNQRVGFVRPHNSADKSFVFHLLRFLRPEIEELGTGTAQANVAPKDILNLLVPRFSQSERLAVAEILDSIEDKIYSNQLLAKFLEEIAQTIFKSWFIDFDPVKAKMAGEKPVGMDDVTAALFPDSMEDSELGPIPKGWKVSPISSFGKVVTGKTPSTKNKEYWGEEVPFVTIPDMHGQTLVGVTKRLLSKKGADSQSNQYLPQGSSLVSCIATPGLVAYATEVCQSNQQINSVIPNDGHPSVWLFWHLRNMIPALVHRSGIGTVFANLNKSDFSSLVSIVPNESLRFAYATSVDILLQKIRILRDESRSLETLRDSLLPRLISGELQIPEEMLVS